MVTLRDESKKMRLVYHTRPDLWITFGKVIDLRSLIAVHRALRK
jgi:hypothetical protein